MEMSETPLNLPLYTALMEVCVLNLATYGMLGWTSMRTTILSASTPTCYLTMPYLISPPLGPPCTYYGVMLSTGVCFV